MIIAIDFDGTISRGKYPAIDGLQPYAVDTVNALYDAGHYIIINTCRSGEQLLAAINWMLQQGIKFHRVNDNHPETPITYGSNSRKIYAHVYIDDKNLGGFPGWLQAYEMIQKVEEDFGTTQTNTRRMVCEIDGCELPVYGDLKVCKHHLLDYIYKQNERQQEWQISQRK